MSGAAWAMLGGAVIAALALVVTLRNLARYRAAPAADAIAPPLPPVAVCIPARNEEGNIEACVRSVLRGRYPALRVLVYDDQSTDATPAILRRLAAEDPRVRIVPTEALAPGWNGKQWACDRMGRAAADEGCEWLLFTDADVRFGPDAVARAVAAAQRSGADLLSTFPRQVTGTLGEAVLVPMIHFILLSYLPIGRMRTTKDPNASAGCGQFLLVRRGAYLAAGGHGAVRDSMHDGIKLPRALRRAGFRTDLFDGTDLASCRMYRGTKAAWRGFAKNAFEGVGSVGLLVLLTGVHLLGHVAPWVYLPLAGARGFPDAAAAGLAGIAVACALVQRGVLARRFGHPPASVVLHPVGVLGMTLIQWHSLYLAATGQRAWRGRVATTPARAGAVAP